MTTHIDLFAGPAGFGTGLRAAGVRTAAAVELDPAAADTHRHNHPDVPLLEADVRGVAADDLLRVVPGGPLGDGVLLTAGVPCQTFSHAGATSRAAYDGRQVLYREAVRLAAGVRAAVVLLECVPGIRTKRLEEGRPALVIDALRRELDGAGYTNRLEGVLDAADFGVPQRRRRWFLLAARDRGLTLRFPAPTTAGRPVSVREAFAGLPERVGVEEYVGPSSGYADRMRDAAFWQLPAAAGTGRPTRHHAPGHRAATVARFSLVRPGRRVTDLPGTLDPAAAAGLRARGVLPRAGFDQRGYRLHPDRPAPTVTGHVGEEFLHPRANRVVTVREAARLQSFPDGHLVGGRLAAPGNCRRQTAYRQVGNAVPPLLAYHLGLAIEEVLR